MKAYIGVDPGSNGSLTAIFEDGSIKSIRFNKLTEKEIFNQMSELAFGYDCFCTIEDVHAMPGQGVTSMFTFGDSCGFIRGMLVATSIPHEFKTPLTWMKGLSIPKRAIEKDPATKKELPSSESKTQYKNRLKEKAEQLFPSIKVTLDIADSILIAEFTRRTRQYEK